MSVGADAFDDHARVFPVTNTESQVNTLIYGFHIAFGDEDLNTDLGRIA